MPSALPIELRQRILGAHLPQGLKPAEIAWLVLFYDKIFDRHFNLNLTKETIAGNFPSHRRGDAKKMLDKLRTKGYFQRHGGRRNPTFYITRVGAEKAEEYKKQV